MRAYHDKDFMHAEVQLDDGEFTGCCFDKCLLRYAGGEMRMIACTFTGCYFLLEGAAANTVELLKGMREMAPDLFKSITGED